MILISGKEIKENMDITVYNGFKIPTKAKYVFEYTEDTSLDVLQDFFTWVEKEKLHLLFIGSGTNLFFANSYFDGVVFLNQKRGLRMINEDLVFVNSGELISTLVNFLLEQDTQKYRGIYAFKNLPGTFGGAVYGNAGCFWLEIKDIIQEVTVYNYQTKQIEIFPLDKCNFSYRDSFFKENKHCVILDGIINVSNLSNIEFSFEEIDEKRKLQPKGRSCGSFFKNPIGMSAGKIIDELWLKGYSVWNAFVSTEHANFILCKEGATSDDVQALVHHIKYRAYTEKGVNLEPEVNIIF